MPIFDFKLAMNDGLAALISWDSQSAQGLKTAGSVHILGEEVPGRAGGCLPPALALLDSLDRA
jgi:hypothetical protein